MSCIEREMPDRSMVFWRSFFCKLFFRLSEREGYKITPCTTMLPGLDGPLWLAHRLMATCVSMLLVQSAFDWQKGPNESGSLSQVGAWAKDTRQQLQL